MKAVCCVSFSPDGKRLAVASSDGVRLLGVGQQNQLGETINVHDFNVVSTIMWRDDQNLITAGDDYRICFTELDETNKVESP